MAVAIGWAEGDFKEIKKPAQGGEPLEEPANEQTTELESEVSEQRLP